jgi:hypothetical protein
MMNWKGCGRKLCWSDLGNPRKISVKIDCLRVENRTPTVANTNSDHATETSRVIIIILRIILIKLAL